jgi:hypothetical protein
VGRYLPVIASLPEGKDPKEAIKEATKVSLTATTRITCGVNPIFLFTKKAQTGGVEATEVSDVGGFFITIEGKDGSPPYVSFAQAMWISAWVGEPFE